jgi:hypothetical protein
MIDFDKELMANTAERMEKSIAADLASLEDSHGIGFAASVAANIGITLLTTIIAAAGSAEARLITTTEIMLALAANLRIEMAAHDADKIIASAMEKARGA